MKHLICTAAALLLVVGSSMGQFKKGDLELQISAGFGSVETKSTVTPSTYNSPAETRKHMEIIACPGYYLIDGLSVEMELAVQAMEKNYPAQSVLFNLSYTYPIPQTSIAPFAHAGYGISNEYRLPGVTITNDGRSSDKMDVKVLNLGAGAKFLLSKHAAFVAEINYRKYSYSTSETFGQTTYTMDYTFSNIGLLCGVSIIL